MDLSAHATVCNQRHIEFEVGEAPFGRCNGSDATKEAECTFGVGCCLLLFARQMADFKDVHCPGTRADCQKLCLNVKSKVENLRWIGTPSELCNLLTCP